MADSFSIDRCEKGDRRPNKKVIEQNCEANVVVLIAPSYMEDRDKRPFVQLRSFHF